MKAFAFTHHDFFMGAFVAVRRGIGDKFVFTGTTVRGIIIVTLSLNGRRNKASVSLPLRQSGDVL